MGLIIRTAEVEDTPELVALGMRFAVEHPLGKWSNSNPTTLESVLVPLIMQFGVAFVAEVDGRIVGALALIAQPSYMGIDLFAEEVAWWVNPEARGTAGIRLVDAALMWCSQHNVDVVKMSVPIGSEAGRVLERRGFEATETAFLLRLPKHVAVQQQGRHDSDDSGPHGSGRRDDAHNDDSGEPGPRSSS